MRYYTRFCICGVLFTSLVGHFFAHLCETVHFFCPSTRDFTVLLIPSKLNAQVVVPRTDKPQHTCTGTIIQTEEDGHRMTTANNTTGSSMPNTEGI